MNTKYKKAISLFTSLTTICWLAGLEALPVNVNAVTINEGDLIRGPDGIKVYIVNANGFKRHIFNPEVFNMYGHLKWSNIKEVDQVTLDSYTASDIYRVDTDYRVFSVTADGGKRHLNMTAEQFVASGYSWGQIFIINEKEGNYYTLGADLPYGEATPSPTVSPTVSPTATPEAEAGALTVVLAADNPVSANIPAGVTGAIFLKFTVSGITTLNEVVIKRSGAGTASDLTAVYLYDGATRLTSGRSVASDTNTATFVNLNLAVGAGKTLTVKADIAAWATVTGKQDRFEVSSINGTAVTGIVGNLMSYANVTAGTATIAETSTAWQVTLGSSAVEVAKFSITEAGGLHNLLVNGITIRHSGTLNNEYVGNLVMKVGTTEVGTCSALTGDKAVFVFPTQYTVPKGEAKNFVVYGDITGGRAADTIQFYLDELSDLDAVDGTYGYGPVLTNNWASADQVVTIAGGQLTIGFNGPSASSIAQNTTNVDFLKFSLTAERAFTVKKIKVTAAIKSAAGVLIAEGTTATNEDWDYLKNIKIVDLTAGTTLVGPLSDADEATWVGGTGYQKEFSDPFDLTAGATRQLSVRADVDTLFSAGRTIEFSIDLSGANYVYDTGAAQYVAAAKIVPNTLDGYQMTVAGSTLTLTKASTPVSTTVVKGASDVETLGIILTAGTADAVKLNKLVVRLYADDGVTSPFDNSGYGSTAANTIVQTVNLYDDAGTLIKGPVNLSLVGTAGSSGGYYKAEFTNLAYDFAAGAQKKFIVKANLLNTFTGNKYIAADVWPANDAEGENSKGVTLTFTGANLNLADHPSPKITCSQGGTLSVAVDAGTPVEAIVVAGSTGVEFTKYKFTAANEAFIVKGLKLANASANYDDELGAITLSYPKDAAGTVEEKTGYLSSGALTFADGQVGIYVPKDDSAVLTIKSSLKTMAEGADTGDKPKITLATTGFIYEGVSSGAKTTDDTLTITGTGDEKQMVVRKSKPTMASGTLPLATLAAGSQTLYKWTVSADSAADIGWGMVVFNVSGYLNSLSIGTDDVTTPSYDGIYTITAGNATNDVKGIDTFTIWDMGTNTAVTGKTIATNAMTGSTGFFARTNASGTYYLGFEANAEQQVAKGTTKTYELRGNVLVVGGTNTTNSTQFRIADIATSAITKTYALVHAGENVGAISAANNTPPMSFVWTDRSIASHGVATADWTDDYKVPGIPTTTLTMSK